MHTVIRRRDPKQRMARHHLLALQGSLNRAWNLVHEWSRIGSPGSVRWLSFPTEHDATTATRAYLARKQREGYR